MQKTTTIISNVEEVAEEGGEIAEENDVYVVPPAVKDKIDEAIDLIFRTLPK
jgi:hypothetical protein